MRGSYLAKFFLLLTAFLLTMVFLWLLWQVTRNEDLVGFTAIAIGLAAFLAGII